MLCSDSRVDRSASVSSMRSTNVPSLPWARSQLNSAVRALPTWSCPVGLGANRTRIQQSSVVSRQSSQKRDGVGRNSLAAAYRVDSFVRLGFHADSRGVEAQRGGYF